MAFMVSPGINVSEIDLTAGVQQLSVSDAAFAGPFQWGPALEVKNIGSEDELVQYFGKPDDTVYSYWFSAQSFLAYSNLLHCARAISANALNSSTAAKTLTGTVNGTYMSNAWTNATSTFVTGFGTSPVIVPGQKILIGGVDYVVGTVSNTSGFTTTTNSVPVALTLTVNVASGNCNVIVFTGATDGLVSNQTITIGGVNATVNAVSSLYFTTAAPVVVGVTNAAVNITSFSANTVATYGTKINNSDAYDDVDGTISGFGSWVAKYPGEFGNSLKVSVCASNAAFLSNGTTGTLTVNTSSTTAVGGSSKFQTELIVGDYLVVGGNAYKIASIQSNTALTLTTTPVADVTAAAAGTWFRRWEHATLFDSAPLTSPYAATRGGSLDEMHVVVIDEDGTFTGVPGTELERYEFLSKGSDAKTSNGDNNYYKDVINRKSQYIWWAGAPTSSTTNFGTSVINTTFGAAALPDVKSLVGGQTKNDVISVGEIEEGYDLFSSVDEIDVSLVIAGPANATLANYLIQNLAETRKDCVVYCSPTQNNVVSNMGSEVADITTYRNSLTSSSYGIMDSGWKYCYDKYNDKYRWVPLNGDMAGIAARADTTNDPWFSPAGFNRGVVKNVVKLAWNPKQLDRDDLYKIGVNPVVSFPAQGVVLYGDKTLLDRPSAFDRINVRRLFIILEKTIARLARTHLFEFNDELTRSLFRNTVEPYLRDVKARRGVIDFRVICDTTNNTPEVIEQNRFVGDIYVKPSRAINFIQLNFVAVRNGVSFQEVTGVS